jgi:glutamate/tyrosine decarboxylase-like PLP-dependent enzyme
MDLSNSTFEVVKTAVIRLHSEPRSSQVLPTSDTIEHARTQLASKLPSEGLGLQKIVKHLEEDLAPAFNASSHSPNYYGFVTGGCTPAASIADNYVTAFDQNVSVHLPNETIATGVEDRALSLLCELLDFQPKAWPHRIFTTGATASNVLGLACGREYVIAEASAHRTDAEVSVGEYGIVEAMHRAGLDKIQILTTVPHSSLSKAAAILGLGRASIIHVGRNDAPHKFDINLLKSAMEQPSLGTIVAVSASEVNTGLYATSGLEEMQELRRLCDMYGAWIHVDGAFGILGRVLDAPQHQSIIDACAGLELADSITGDGHKLLNVPYDCGFFFSRHRNIAERVFQNPNASYLATNNGPDSIVSRELAEVPSTSGLRQSPGIRQAWLQRYVDTSDRAVKGHRKVHCRKRRLCTAPCIDCANTRETRENLYYCALPCERFKFKRKLSGSHQSHKEDIRQWHSMGRPACLSICSFELADECRKGFLSDQRSATGCSYTAQNSLNVIEIKIKSTTLHDSSSNLFLNPFSFHRFISTSPSSTFFPFSIPSPTLKS